MDNLRQKIIDLFEYRRLPLLVSNVSDSDHKDLFESLYRLQSAIYHLDHELESNWSTNDMDLESHWASINHILTQEFQIHPNNLDSYVCDIKTYQRHELDIRDGILPTSMDPLFFYYYKSCDVKLIRRLLLENVPGLENQFTLSDWEAFDLVTEINDDIEDVFEDLNTINGNAYLIDSIMNGPKHSHKLFANLMMKVKQMNSGSVSKSWIKRLTKDCIDETSQLLSKRILDLRENKARLAHSAIACKMLIWNTLPTKKAISIDSRWLS